MNDNWLIWSNEQKRWWKSGGRGYTNDVKEAGRYTIDEAYRILCDSNQSSWHKEGMIAKGAVYTILLPKETMVPESSLPKV